MCSFQYKTMFTRNLCNLHLLYERRVVKSFALSIVFSQSSPVNKSTVDTGLPFKGIIYG